jgi:hypothetical protein
LPRLCQAFAACTDDRGMITHKIVLALVAVAGVGASPQPGTWQRLPAAPISPEFNARTSIWTGTQMLVFGRDQRTALDAHGQPYATGAVNVAAAYDPASKSWRKLDPPAKTPGFMNLASVWTGKEMLVWGQGTHLAYNPGTDRWRQLAPSRLLSVHDGFGAVVWTGKEMLGWGGGCCGDAFADGVAYNPASNTWRALPRAPLSGNQHPLGVWTGKEYVVVAGAHAASYNRALNKWRRLAAPPALGDRVLWTGRDVVMAGASRNVFAFRPATNRWRRLPLVPAGRVGHVVVWDGSRLLMWGGARGGAIFIPGMKEWTVFARGPLPARIDPTAVWTGNSVLVWGGVPTKTWGTYGEAGAAFTPPVLGCGDAWMGQNLVATRKVKAALRAAYAAAHRGTDVRAALAGHTYYGSYSGTSYALATFGAAPTIFRTDARGRWQVRQDTRGHVCSNVVPIDLIKAWSLRHVARGCYAPPA